MWKKNAVERNCNKREDILASLSSIISTFLRFRLMQFNLKKSLCGYPRCHFKALQRLKKKKKLRHLTNCLWKLFCVTSWGFIRYPWVIPSPRFQKAVLIQGWLKSEGIKKTQVPPPGEILSSLHMFKVSLYLEFSYLVLGFVLLLVIYCVRETSFKLLLLKFAQKHFLTWTVFLTVS